MKSARLMMIMAAFAAAVLLGAGQAAWAQELLTNGNFEIDFSGNWLIDSLAGMSPTLDTIDRAVDYDPDGDYEARLTKYDSPYNRLYQTVAITNLNVDFAIRAKIFCVELNPALTYWVTASVALSYMNASDSVLGETRIIAKSPHCAYANSPVFHMIEAPDTNWNDYSFNVANELANLPGVNQADIAKIRVALFDTTNGC